MKDVVPPIVRIIEQKYFISLTLINVPIEERDNIMDEENIRENIEFARSILIGTQESNYDYNN